ncbi:MAG: hypothetical protein IKM61_02765 [Eubacteriaceae bacterium]|nr:hypothetical protein [Eubacteriaceae bacterium]
MNTQKIYKEYLSTSEINTDILASFPDEASKIRAMAEIIISGNVTDAVFAEKYMRALGYDAQASDLAVKFLSLTDDKRAAKVFSGDVAVREAVINHYCSVMANFIVFSTAQRKNLKDTASYNRHIDKALPEMCESLTVLFELGANEGEYLTSLDKYFEFTYYVNTPDSWKLFNSLYVYDDFRKYVESIKDKFLGIYLRSALLPEAVEVFILEGDEKFTEAFITAVSELASENISQARKTYSKAVTVENDENFIENMIDLYDGMKYKNAIAHFKANSGKFHLSALSHAKDYYEYEESPRAKEF